MHRSENRLIAALVFAALLAAGCGSAATPALAPTLAPLPTYTPYPTNTPYPTVTRLPPATPTVSPAPPTPTVVPSATPLPTSTPTPGRTGPQGCSTSDRNAYEVMVEAIANRFFVAIQGSMLDEERTTKAEMVTVRPPACAARAHSLYLKVFDEAIETTVDILAKRLDDASQHTAMIEVYKSQYWEALYNGDIVVSETMYVSAGGDGVYVRSEPDRTKQYKVWPDRTAIGVIAKAPSGWARVQTPDGYVGYIPIEYLSASVPVVPTATSSSRSQTYGKILLSDWTWRVSYGYIYVEGLLQNTSYTEACFVKIQFSVLDASHNFLGADYGYTSGNNCLVAGERATFKLMTSNRTGAAYVRIENITYR
jgi:hypothetical protein